jgi:hypothetical protein
VEGSEEHFDENEPVDDGLSEEARSTDGEDGSSEEVDENEEEGCLSPEGSDFAAEEGYEEGDSNAEEGHEEVWGEVMKPCQRWGIRMCLVYLYLLVSMCTTPSVSSEDF